ncbi:hypothetical protein [Clostridium sp. C105KSO13]|uniref:hypothetical protein n=1 Tax=Clostridium sp. C105KSO13 TaxID=1776045 RepID=UPI0007405B4C|nr:hypothetical protein [Clostridium sp. C105KSO13]CUX26912.1 hypothetical protein BN3456_00948 [Clostridium sp. C105KSO13]
MFDYYNYGNMDSVMTGILAIYMIILALCFIFYVISYIFKGIGMFTIAKRQGMDSPWLAFIPFARTYLHGELGGSITLKSKNIKNPGIWLLALPFIAGAVNFIFYLLIIVVGFGTVFSSLFDYRSYGDYSYSYAPQIGPGTVLGIIVLVIIWIILLIAYEAIYKVFGVLVNHQILERFTTKNMSVAHAVLCSTIPLYESICFFVMRNKDFNPGMELDSEADAEEETQTDLREPADQEKTDTINM